LFIADSSEEHVMRRPTFTAAHSDLISVAALLPLAALLLSTALGGCVAYTSHPPGYYSYNYPYGYYGGYRSAYGYPGSYAAYPSTYDRRPLYSPDYNSTFNTYETSGGGR
jgi:hypothetical protein